MRCSTKRALQEFCVFRKLRFLRTNVGLGFSLPAEYKCQIPQPNIQDLQNLIPTHFQSYLCPSLLCEPSNVHEPCRRFLSPNPFLLSGVPFYLSFLPNPTAKEICFSRYIFKEKAFIKLATDHLQVGISPFLVFS